MACPPPYPTIPIPPAKGSLLPLGDFALIDYEGLIITLNLNTRPGHKALPEPPKSAPTPCPRPPDCSTETPPTSAHPRPRLEELI